MFYMLRKNRIKRPLQLLWLRSKGLIYSFTGTKQYEKFVIITRSRTGSNLLVSLLNSHPNVVAYGEMFNRLHGLSPQNIWSSVFTHLPQKTQQVGFKIFYYHPLDSTNKWVWERIYNDPSLRIIHLIRENMLRTHVSRQIASLTMEWKNHSKKTQNTSARKTIYLDPNECINVFEKTQMWAKQCRDSLTNHRTFELSYQELTGREQKSQLRTVQRFLGIEPISLGSPLKKQNDADLKELISNYSEVKSALMGTQWEHFLDDKET
jgi:LPS sulfotransferase NodH